MTLALEPIRPHAAQEAGLTLLELFNDAGVLAESLLVELEYGHFTDAYLLAAGILQVLEDRGGPLTQLLRRAAAATAGPGAFARCASAALRGLAELARIAGMARGQTRRLGNHERSLHELVGSLAEAVLEPPPEAAATELAAHGSAVADALVADSSALPSDVVRMPSCFRSFDQRPADFVALARRLFEQRSLSSRPVLVVGARTSGSYLAPLVAAALRALGVEEVSFCTARPGWPLGPVLRRLGRRVAHRHGLVVVVDDPPTSGGSLRTLTDQLVRAGLPSDSVSLLLALFDDRVPGPLADLDVVALSPCEWTIRELDDPTRLAARLSGLLPHGERVVEVHVVAGSDPRRRDHARVRFDAVIDGGELGRHERRLVAEGTGFGYFGRQVVAVIDASSALFPESLGWCDGVLIREYLPSSERIDRVLEDGGDQLAAARGIALHLTLRQAACKVNADRSIDLAGRQPAWEVAARITAATAGRAAPLARAAFVDDRLRRALTARSPSIIDGSADRSGWFVSGSPPVRKIAFSEGPFGHHDLASYDAAFDVAGAAVAFGSPRFAAAVRREFEELSGWPITPEQWMCLRLVHLWNERRLGERDGVAYRRGAARVLQELFAETLLADLPNGSGPLVALDLDGVLETSPLGFPATTRAGALALRTLIAHGSRTILASGRSASEVEERLETYGLSAGVAEYGAFLVADSLPRPICLLDTPARSALDRFRHVVESEDGLEIDPDYSACIRVLRRDAHGARHGIDGASAEELLARARATSNLKVIAGEEQTDFVPRCINKGAGIRSLLRVLGDERSDLSRPLLAAVGDSESDRSMLELAHRRFAPANCADALRSGGVEVVDGRYQRGLADAVGRLVGHEVGTCDRCGPPSLTPDTEALLDVLSIQEAGPLLGAGRILALAMHDQWSRRRR